MLNKLKIFIGQRVSKIEQAFYVFNGEITDMQDCIIQFTMDNGFVFHLDGYFGSLLDVINESWLDPFSGELSPENQEFIKVSGKWTLFDTSDNKSCKTIIGKVFTNYVPIFDREDLVGVRLIFEDKEISFVIIADTGVVTFNSNKYKNIELLEGI